MLNNREDLFDAMKNGTTIITPNNRLSNQLLHDFFKRTAGPNIACDKVSCVPYPSYLVSLFHKARHLYPTSHHPILLSAEQQRCLWKQIISQHQGLCHEGLLSEIQEAWVRCQHWEISSTEPAFAKTPQTELFQELWQQFQAELDARHAVTAEQLCGYLLTIPELFNNTTLWASFDDYTPQQRSLQDAMTTAGYPPIFYDLSAENISTQLYPANDRHDEYEQMIHFINHRLAAGDKRIAVVIPELQTEFRSIERLLQRHIPLEQFNISLGHPLLDTPLVAQALDFLRLDQAIDNHQARLLLQSPYLAGSRSEFHARSQLMQEDNVLQAHTIPLSSFIKAIKKDAPTLSSLLTNLANYPKQAAPSEWIALFKHRLTELGFPGDYSLDSANYQYLQRFLTLLDAFMPLSVINPVMMKTEALNALADLAKSTIFQVQTSTTPVQILGLLEASGCTFDSIWVCGMSDQCLPHKTNLSAFIPIDIQRDNHMPHAVAARELQFAQQLIQRLQQGCRQSVFSFPRLMGDIPNLASPLICKLPTYTPYQQAASLSETYLTEHEETYDFPLRANEPVKGGTALLANQAKCPFRAFAKHRLYAQAAPLLSDGLSPIERGTLIHHIMDILWQGLGTQEHLNSLTTDALQQRINEAISLALSQLVKARENNYPALLQDIETDRLQRLVNASLEWEKQREPFVIEAVEQEFTLTLAGIDFRVRVDRLDKLASGNKWVIDYKTKLPLNKPWNEDRPEEPQLLLYALLDAEINALLFVQLNAGRVLCSGLSEDTHAVRGMGTLKKDDSWSERQAQWRQQLTDLAQEFQDGHCPPTPYRGSTCQRCDFSNLCRI